MEINSPPPLGGGAREGQEEEGGRVVFGPEAYLDDGTLPKKTPASMGRFLRVANNFEMNEEGEIVLITNQPTPEMEELGLKAETPTTYTVIAPDAKKNIVENVFTNIFAGGFKGVESIYQKLASQYIGITRKDVAEVLGKMELKQLKRPILSREIKPILTEAPMEYWQMDLIDFSKLEYDRFNNGFRYVLNVIDIFSEFLWSFPLKNKSAAVVAFTLQNLFLTEGHPKILGSDNGSEFKQEVETLTEGKELEREMGEVKGFFQQENMIDLAGRFSIEFRHGQPYKSNTMGGVERVNRNIRDSIFAYLQNTKGHKAAAKEEAKENLEPDTSETELDTDAEGAEEKMRKIQEREAKKSKVKVEAKVKAGGKKDDSSKRWVDKLPFFTYVYNASVHSTIKTTPFTAHRGRAGLVKMDAVIKERIKVKAERMVKQYARERDGLVVRRGKKLDEKIEVGDSVRISTQSMIEVRKQGDIKVKSKLKKGLLSGYSSTVYTVVRIEEKEDGTVLYKLDGEHKRNYYQRHELMKIDPENLIEVSGEKPQLDFGAGGFDLEDHLVNMRAGRAAEQSRRSWRRTSRSTWNRSDSCGTRTQCRGGRGAFRSGVLSW